jgi:hypothetical protein
MLNLNRSIFQSHPFHLVSPSPWPLYTSFSLLTFSNSISINKNVLSNKAIILLCSIAKHLSLLPLILFTISTKIAISIVKAEYNNIYFIVILLLFAILFFIFTAYLSSVFNNTQFRLGKTIKVFIAFKLLILASFASPFVNNALLLHLNSLGEDIAIIAAAIGFKEHMVLGMNNPGVNPPTGNPPTGNPHGGGQGYYYDPVTGNYIIEDPTGVLSTPFNSPLSKQPYASNMARALEHHWKHNNFTKVTFLRANDRAFWEAFCRTQGQGTYNWNSAPKCQALRNLP